MSSHAALTHPALAGPGRGPSLPARPANSGSASTSAPAKGAPGSAPAHAADPHGSLVACTWDALLPRPAPQACELTCELPGSAAPVQGAGGVAQEARLRRPQPALPAARAPAPPDPRPSRRPRRAAAVAAAARARAQARARARARARSRRGAQPAAAAARGPAAAPAARAPGRARPSRRRRARCAKRCWRCMWCCCASRCAWASRRARRWCRRSYTGAPGRAPRPLRALRAGLRCLRPHSRARRACSRAPAHARSPPERARAARRLDQAERIRAPPRGAVRRNVMDVALDKATRLEAEAGPPAPLPFMATVLVLGMAGVGKSATINSLLGSSDAANTGTFAPATRKARPRPPGSPPCWHSQQRAAAAPAAGPLQSAAHVRAARPGC